MKREAISERFRLIYEIGCIVCLGFAWKTPCQAHHLNLGQHAGQKRLGDEATIGLCPWHHVGEPIAGMSQQLCTYMLGPSMKHEPVRFREVFGTDEQLLARQNRLIAQRQSLKVGA